MRARESNVENILGKTHVLVREIPYREERIDEQAIIWQRIGGKIPWNEEINASANWKGLWSLSLDWCMKTDRGISWEKALNAISREKEQAVMCSVCLKPQAGNFLNTPLLYMIILFLGLIIEQGK